MRNILDRKFWSLGTPLGSLGPPSQGDIIVGPYRLQILVIWGPYEPPVLVACQATAENPKSVGSWCEECCIFAGVSTRSAFPKTHATFKFSTKSSLSTAMVTS